MTAVPYLQKRANAWMPVPRTVPAPAPAPASLQNENLRKMREVGMTFADWGVAATG